MNNRWDRPYPEGLRLPIGAQDSGPALVLDLNSAADGGAGPFGLVIGARGSGKSEILSVVALGLALGNPPEQVNLLLGQGREGSALSGIENLPHVIGHCVANDRDDSEVDFFHVVESEIIRRREIVPAGGDFRACRLPALVIIIDDADSFGGEDTISAIVGLVDRVGHAVGAQLLISVGDLIGPAADRGAVASYRICLEALSANGSRQTGEIPDADDLPDTAGHGYLRLADGSVTRFRAPHTSYSVHTKCVPEEVAGSGVALPVALSAVLTDRHATYARVAEIRRRNGMKKDPADVFPNLSGGFDFAPFHRIGDVGDLDVKYRWRRKPYRDRLRVPIGVADNGTRVVLDLKSPAGSDSAPIGVVTGFSGSGKSQILMSAVLGLVVENPPEQVSILLGQVVVQQTFNQIEELPHIIGFYPELSSQMIEPELWEPSGIAAEGDIFDVIDNEITRRWDVVRAAGDFRSFVGYAEAVDARRPPIPRLPALVIVIDDVDQILVFSEENRAKFSKVLDRIDRLGSVVGVHLLCSASDLHSFQDAVEAVRTYRIGMKQFSPRASRQIVGIPDAYDLPEYQNYGYIRTAGGTVTRFQAPTSSYRVHSNRIAEEVEGCGVFLTTALSSILARYHSNLVHDPHSWPDEG
ncbi:FtsK/SpoIIIE domain-containing protein [Nocardia sp. NPDC052254]|uniref:FtsK/SpoIIIE domain-containing protein n=1 Tax=Nocardia sp. NPDC052254 TaxID=3155681 RepID=UPI003431478A